jgi:hypothetical protein
MQTDLCPAAEADVFNLTRLQFNGAFKWSRIAVDLSTSDLRFNPPENRVRPVNSVEAT